MKPALQRMEAEERSRPRSRQIEIGTRGALILFFALAVVCGMFFAFGYTLGKHAIPATFRLGAAPPEASAKPPVLSPSPTAPAGVQPPNPAELGAAESNQTPATLVAANGAGTPPNANSGTAAGASAATTAATTTPPPPSSSAGNPAPAPAPAGANAAAANSQAANAAGHGPYLVQVFAGRKADADSLAAALQQKGYPVQVASPGPGETDLYRVQVGPYLTLDEAQAMRSRLIADGYQAIVK